jgi:hypothetical protein
MKMKYVYEGKKAKVEYKLSFGLSIDYEESLKLLHPEINWESKRIGDYEGDVISVGFDEEGNWYYKNNSYGSCSGCDWVESINEEKDAIEFFKHQEVIVELGKDKEKVKEYLKKEIQNCYDFKEEDLKEFIEFVDKRGINENER